MDNAWWEMYASCVSKEFKGERFSNNKQNSRYNVTLINNFKAYGNSGAASIALAVKAGAKKIILLGYDCKKTNGEAHWHGNHPVGLGNAKAIDKWHLKFAELAKDFKDVEIINATRDTALTMFKTAILDDILI